MLRGGKGADTAPAATAVATAATAAAMTMTTMTTMAAAHLMSAIRCQTLASVALGHRLLSSSFPFSVELGHLLERAAERVVVVARLAVQDFCADLRHCLHTLPHLLKDM